MRNSPLLNKITFFPLFLGFQPLYEGFEELLISSLSLIAIVSLTPQDSSRITMMTPNLLRKSETEQTESVKYPLLNLHLLQFCGKPFVNGGLPPQKLRLVINYINAHMDEALALETLANLVNISPSYFLTQFKSSTGLAPHQYIINQRLEQAKTLLTQTQLSIADIASQTGFADQSHLTRLMRRHTGLTPKLLRGNRFQQFCQTAVDSKSSR
jgi:AraC-like DNA-binding protein